MLVHESSYALVCPRDVADRLGQRPTGGRRAPCALYTRQLLLDART